jgi:hypothetical protein
MSQKRLTIILSSALVLAVVVAVVFLSPLGSIFTGAPDPTTQQAQAKGSQSSENSGTSIATTSGEAGNADAATQSGTGAADVPTDVAAQQSGAQGGNAGNAAGGSAGNTAGGANGGAAGATGDAASGSGSGGNQPVILTCYVSIDCAVVFNDWGNLNPSKRAYIPAGGWILGKTPVYLQEGQTVFDALQAVTRNNGIQMDATGPAYAAYIRGIANVYERDCGALSGWKFSVNGSFPNVGCGQVKLRDGDVVNWTFSLHV